MDQYDAFQTTPLAPVAPPPPPPVVPNAEINFFGATSFRNQNRKFGIKIDDRRRHMYLVGKTGMGKTTLLENMVINDIYAGHGIGVVDPHGDFAEKIINFIPPHRINDVVYFNPADIDFPIGFNILETIRPDQKHLIVSGLMGVFKKIWPDVWSARMEYILNNTILALIDFPGSTLLGINRLLADEDYRRRVVNNSKDPVVKSFWQTEFAGYNDKYKQEAVAPIQNKIGQFLSASVIRNIVAQVKSRIHIREMMDERKIFIMNLSKGRIGEDNSRLLGGMLITKIQLAAMERVDILEKDRKDFFLYVDEFQNFATESFANILSEARKYRLDLIMAHQYMEQLDEMVLAAVIGNVGTMVTFRVGSTDAEILAKELSPTFVEEDLVNLPKFQTYLKLMIDGVASRPFSATTLAPIGSPTDSAEKVVKVSRERYAVSREKIETKIMRWSGMMVMPEDEAGSLEVDDDEAMFEPDVHPVQTQSNLADQTHSNPSAPSQAKMTTPIQPSKIDKPPSRNLVSTNQRPQPMTNTHNSRPNSGRLVSNTQRSGSGGQSSSINRSSNSGSNRSSLSHEKRSGGGSGGSGGGRGGGGGSNSGRQNFSGGGRATGMSGSRSGSGSINNGGSTNGRSNSNMQNEIKKKNNSFPIPEGQNVLLVDPDQKGISLTEIIKKNAPDPLELFSTTTAKEFSSLNPPTKKSADNLSADSSAVHHPKTLPPNQVVKVIAPTDK